MQFSSASVVYYIASVLFPAKETILAAPIMNDNDESEKSVSEIGINDEEKASTMKIDA